MSNASIPYHLSPFDRRVVSESANSQEMSSSRGRGRGRGGGGGWGREDGRHNEVESPRFSQHRSSNDVRNAQRGDWGSKEAGTSMQQLHLQPRPAQQQQPVMLATSRGVQHVRQPQQQQQQQRSNDHNHNGRQHNRQRNWNRGNSQQGNQQHVQHHHQNGQQSRQTHQVLQPQQQHNQRQQPQPQSQRQLQQIQQRNEAASQQRGKRRRQTSGFYQGRAAEQHGAAAVGAAAADPDDLPGFTRCPRTGNYYRITADSSGLVGHRVSDVRAAERLKREEEEAKKKKEEEEEMRRRSTVRRPPSTLSLLSSLSLGRLSGSALPRAAAAMRMQQLPTSPTQVIDVTDFLPLDPFSGMHSVVGCEFLDVSADGETLTGCWAFAGPSGSRAASMACSLQTNVAERGAGKKGEKQWLGVGPLRGTPVGVRASAIVDMAMAPFDRDVTCLLYTTATNTLDRSGRPITVCDVSTRPVLCRSDEDFNESPIYNVQARLPGNVYSCAWSQKHMKIGLGMERHVSLFDPMCGQKRRVETRDKMAITQTFDESGDTLYLGLRYVNSCIMDTRTKMEKPVAVIPDSRNTGWMRLLQRSGPQVVLSTLEGKLCLYDIRRPVVALRSFDGHRSASGARLPSFVDHDEQFLFAVGADFATRVWSLQSGTLLHELTAPAATTSQPNPSDYPRPVFSRSWAGKQGQDALLVAAGTHINVYRLGEQME